MSLSFPMFGPHASVSPHPPQGETEAGASTPPLGRRSVRTTRDSFAGPRRAAQAAPRTWKMENAQPRELKNPPQSGSMAGRCSVREEGRCAILPCGAR